MKSYKASQSDTICEHFDGELNGSLMHIIHQLYIGIQKHMEQVLLAKGKLSFSQFLVLVGFSCDKDAALSQAQLAENLALTEATVSRHIKTLVDNNILTKEKDLTNKKAYKLKLTKEGTKIFFDAKKLILKELEKLFTPISDTEKAFCIKSLTPSIKLLEKK